jgi:hypothetical protein
LKPTTEAILVFDDDDRQSQFHGHAGLAFADPLGVALEFWGSLARDRLSGCTRRNNFLNWRR